MELFCKHLVLVICLTIAVSNSTPTTEEKTEVEGSHTSFSSSSSKGPTYTAHLNMKDDDGKCVERAKVEGNGVSDTLALPCTEDKQGRDVINEKDKIIIGGDDHGIFGNKPNSLVVFKNGKCIEKSYSPDGKPKETELNPTDCAGVKKDLSETKEKAKEKEIEKQKEFDNIGKDLDMKPLDLQMDAPKLNLGDPLKSMSDDMELDLKL